MEPILVFRAEGVGCHRLIALHEAHNHIAADQNQPLNHTVSGDDLIRLGKRRGGDVGEGGRDRQTDLNDCGGNADQGDCLDKRPTGPERVRPNLDDRPAAGIEPDQNEEGDELGYGRSQRSACHAQIQTPVKHEHGVQNDIQRRTRDDGDRGDPHGGLRSGRAVHALCRQVGQRRHKHPESVVFGEGEGGLGGAEGPHQGFHEGDAAYAQQDAQHHGESDDGGDGAAGSLMILLTQLPAGQHGGAGGKDVLNGDHDQQQRNRDTDRRQGDIRVQHPDIGGRYPQCCKRPLRAAPAWPEQPA